MRRVSEKAANQPTSDGGEQRATAAAVSSGPRMQSAQAFYRNVAVARFGDATKQVSGAEYATTFGNPRLYEMVTRVADPKVRDLVNSQTASVTPDKLYQGYLALLDKDRELLGDKTPDSKDSFSDILEWGRELLLELREQRAFVFRKQLQSAVDVISKVGAWEPELLFMREIGKRPELGGTDGLLDALDRAYFPKDVVTAIEGQVKSMTAVASTVPPPPATALAARLDENGVVDALLRGDQAYTSAVTALRSASQLKRTMPASNLNLRGQIANVMMLNEVFGRLGAQLNTTELTPAVREILLMTARLATSNQVSALAKSAAFRGIDAVLTRQYEEAVKAQSRGQSVQVPPYKSMAQLLLAAKATLAAEATEQTNSRRDASQTKVVRDAVDDLIGEIFRQGSDANFAVECITSAADPGSILLRTISDTPQRERIVNAAMSAQGASTARIALLSDKARRESELRKRYNADDTFRPGLESSALLLSWPGDLPRPSFEPAAALARADELKSLGNKHKLKGLIEDYKPAKEIFDELLRLSTEARFAVGADDQSMGDTVRKIVAGDLEVKGGFIAKHDHTEALLKSTAIGALEKQMQNGFSQNDVVRNIARAIYTRNGALLNVLPRLLKSTDTKTKVTLDTVVAALSFVHEVKDDKGVVHQVPTVNPGSEDKNGNVVFAYRVLALCKETLGSAIDGQIEVACQNLLKRTGVISLARYAGLTEEEGLVILTQPFPEGVPPDCAHFIPLMGELKLPPTYLQSIVSRPDLGSFPADTLFEIFARCLQDQAVPKDDIVRLAIAGITSRAEFTGELYGTNILATFNELASRGFDSVVGKRILEGLPERLEQAKKAMAADAERRAIDPEYAAGSPAHKAMPPLDAIYRAAAMCAADGKLFKADDVAAAVLALGPAQGDALVREMALHADQFFKGLSDGMRTQVMTRALKSMGEVTDASVLDDARACLQRLADLQSRGVKLGSDVAKILEGLAECALVRAATNPLEIASVRGVLDDARDSGVDVDAIAARLLADPSKAKAAAGMTPNQLLAVRLEAARLVPGTDAALIKSALTGGKYAPGPFVAAFDLVADRDLPVDITKSLCRLAIDWAAGDKAFSAVVDFRKRLVDSGQDDRLAIFDTAFAEAVKDQPKAWEAVPEARALAAATKLKDLQDEIMALAAGGKEAEARAVALADRVASVGAFANELVPQVRSCLRRAVRAQRPSLDDVQFGLNVPQTPTAATPKAATKPAVETVDFHGRLQLEKYQGERGFGVEVPGWEEFTDTPATIHNMETLADALASDKPYVIILGPPGPGKTFTTRAWAHATGTPMLELNGGPERRNDQFIGYWGTDKRSLPFYERADFLKVFTKGGLAVDDEFQGSDAAVLDQHAEFASRFNKTLAIRTNKNEIIRRSPHAKVVVIGNFLEKDIPAKLRENAKIVYFNQLPLEDQMTIAGKSAPSLPEEELQKLSSMQLRCETIVSLNNLSQKMPLSVRNLKRATQLAERYRDDPSTAALRAAREIYLDGLSDPQAKALIGAAYADKDQFGVDPATTIRDGSEIEIRQALDATVFGEAAVMKGPNPRVDLSAVKHENNGHIIPFFCGDRERHELEFAAKVMEKKWPLLYVAPPGAGVGTIIEAMEQMTGLEAFVREVNAETGANELFGEMTVQAIDEKTFKTVWADGFVNSVTKGPGIMVIRDFDKLPRDVQIAMHKTLAERKVPGENGALIDMHPDAHIILTATSQDDIGEAVLNRCVIRALEPKTQTEIAERMVHIAQSLGVTKDIAEQMVNFDAIWSKMINATVATVMGRHNLPVGGMQTLVTWLAEVAQVIRGEVDVEGDDLTEKVRNAFVKCGAKLYIVPGERKYNLNGDAEMSDDEIVKQVLTALYEGDDDQVKALAKIPDEEPKDSKAP